MSGSGYNKAISISSHSPKYFKVMPFFEEAHARKRAALRAFLEVLASGTYPAIIR